MKATIDNVIDTLKAEQKKDTKRLSITIDRSVEKKAESEAKKLGISKSRFLSLFIKANL